MNTPELIMATRKCMEEARDGRGLMVRLCNLSDPQAVITTIREISEWFTLDGTFVGGNESKAASANNLALLSAVLREHALAGNLEA